MTTMRVSGLVAVGAVLLSAGCGDSAGGATLAGGAVSGPGGTAPASSGSGSLGAGGSGALGGNESGGRAAPGSGGSDGGAQPNGGAGRPAAGGSNLGGSNLGGSGAVEQAGAGTSGQFAAAGRGGQNSAAAGSGGAGDTKGGAAGADASGGMAGMAALAPPKSDSSSTLGISAPGSGYKVEGNIPYGPLTMQRLDIIYPNGAGPSGTMTLPGVIMFHGGGWTDTKPSALKASMSSFFSRFLKHGFLVCNVEYRSADGSATGAIAPAADQDALLAAKWFWDYMDYYHVDRSKYVTTGASAGGQLALMVGMATADSGLGPTNPNDFKIAAIVNGYGPADVTDLLAKKVSFAVQWLPADTPNRDAIAKAVSAVTYARNDIPPLITVQGDMDTTVPRNEAQSLFDLLTAAGADNALHWVAGAGHGFSSPASAWPDAETAMFDFLVQHGIGK